MMELNQEACYRERVCFTVMLLFFSFKKVRKSISSEFDSKAAHLLSVQSKAKLHPMLQQ